MWQLKSRVNSLRIYLDFEGTEKGIYEFAMVVKRNNNMIGLYGIRKYLKQIL